MHENASSIRDDFLEATKISTNNRTIGPNFVYGDQTSVPRGGNYNQKFRNERLCSLSVVRLEPYKHLNA